MDWLTAWEFSHPFWMWIAVGAVLLAVEVATNSGWLLWSSACAGLVALLTLAPFETSTGVQIAAFAGLTIVTTLVARRLMPPRKVDDGDGINDAKQRLIGQTGIAAGAFASGFGRVLVEGAEWDAISDAKTISDGARVTVEAVGGARLKVRPL